MTEGNGNQAEPAPINFSKPWKIAEVKIPMLGKNDSLNVSVSAAILLYEAVRQRRLAVPTAR
jgi:tRNA(Leu) C34 or U34 (ribose-2'-O)-methylase TrmL